MVWEWGWVDQEPDGLRIGLGGSWSRGGVLGG